MELTILLGADAGRVLTTDVSPVTIGRDSSNVLALNDERTSRFHAQIAVSSNGAVVEDLGSTNGTLVNGQPVPPRVPRRLQPGDQIKVGNTLLRFDDVKCADQPLPAGQSAPVVAPGQPRWLTMAIVVGAAVMLTLAAVVAISILATAASARASKPAALDSSAWFELFLTPVPSPALAVTSTGELASLGVYEAPWRIEDLVVGASDEVIAYLAEGEGGLRIVDLSDPAAPSVTGIFDSPGYVSDIAVGVDQQTLSVHAFVADQYKGLQILDVTNPAVPTLQGTLDGPSALAVTISNGYVILASADGFLRVIGTDDPYRPTEIASVQFSEYSVLGSLRDLVGMDDRVFLLLDRPSWDDEAFRGLLVFHISDPMRPALAAAYPIAEPVRGLAIGGTSPQVAYVAAGTRGLLILDVTDPERIAQVGRYEMPGVAQGVAVAETSGSRLAYVAAGPAGLRVVDVADPTGPAEVASFQAPDTSASQVVLAGGGLYVAEQGSLRVLSDPRLASVAADAVPEAHSSAGGPSAPSADRGDQTEGDLIYSEDFSDPVTGWDLDSDEQFARDIEDERLILTPLSDSVISWSRPGEDFRDFVVEVTASMDQGTSAGLIMRYLDDDNFYLFELSSEGDYLFYKQSDGEWIDLVERTGSDAIQLDSAPNVVKAICQGETFTFFVNGQRLLSYRDKAYDHTLYFFPTETGVLEGRSMDSGDIALAASTARDDGTAQVSYDDLKVWSLP